MKKMLLLISSLLVVACMDNEVASRKEECLRSPCTDSQCVIWDESLQRCGTPNALRKERLRQEEPKQMQNVQSKGRKISWAEFDKRRNERLLDSIKALDASTGKTLMADEYLENTYKETVSRYENDHKTNIERLRMYEQKTGSPLTAIQWFSEENIRLQAEIDSTNSAEDSANK